MTVVAITGAAGRIGTAMRPLLARADRTVRLIDVAEPPGVLAEREEFVRASIGDEKAMRAALRGAAALVHLAGLASEHPWSQMLETNIHGTYVALESARAAGVRSVFLASSIHAVGTLTLAQAARSVEPSPAPDTLYGVSKAAMEALGHVFGHRYGMCVVSARICHFGDDPGTALSRVIWLSAADLARLIEATLGLGEPGHRVVWGVSRNGAPWLRPEAGAAIGFVAEDECDVPDVAENERLGGDFLDVPLGGG